MLSQTTYTKKQALRTHDVRRIAPRKPGTTILCEQGVLWLTMTGGGVDYILGPGDSFVDHHGRALVVEALREAVFSIN